MLTRVTKEKLFDRHLNRHYFGRLFSTVPLSPFWRGVAGGCLAYLIFLLCVSLGHGHAVLTSFLHLWQLSFSLTIFFGLWLGSLGLNSLRPWLEQLGERLSLSDDDLSRLITDSVERLGSGYSSVMAAPLIAGGLGTAILIARTLPNSLFPFPSYAPAFVYAVFVEMGVLMLHLLAGTGFWIFYVFTKAAQMLSQLKSVDYTLVDEDSMKSLSDTVLRLCIYMLVIIASGMPGVAFVVFSFKAVPLVLLAGTFFGMILPTVGLTLSFFGPVYYLHKMLKKAKSEQTRFLKEQVRICEQSLHEKVTQMAKSKSNTLGQDSEELLALAQFLRERLSESQRRSVWPFDVTSILKLSGSASLPIISFFAEQVIRRALS